MKATLRLFVGAFVFVASLAVTGCGSAWDTPPPSTSYGGGGRTTVYIGHGRPYGGGWGYGGGYRPRPPMHRPPYRPGGPTIQPLR